MQKEYLKNININDIKPNPKNPRKNDDSVDFVVNSMQAVGYITPIIVDENSMILAGHTRYKALKKRGTEIIEEVLKVSGLTEKQKKQFIIADNSAGSKSDWDFDLLGDFDDIVLKELGLDLRDIDFNNKNTEINVNDFNYDNYKIVFKFNDIEKYDSIQNRIDILKDKLSIESNEEFLLKILEIAES